MAEKLVNATKLDTNKLEKNSPVNAATIQPKSSKKLDLIIAILLVLLMIVIGLIVYFLNYG